MLERHTLPGTTPQTAAFLRKTDPKSGVETRAYLDGRRVTTGRDFVTRSGPHQLTVTAYHDGRRLLSLPDHRRLIAYHPGWGRGGPQFFKTGYTRFINGK